MNKDKLKELSKPFAPEDIEWRVQSSGVATSGNPWVMVIPYITSRAIQIRLDEVFNLDWQNMQKATPDGKGYLCGISVKVGDEWITRWDGSEYTNIEPLKGALSGAMKRAGALFGIGRYLYQLDEEFATTREVNNRSECNAPGQNFHQIKHPKTKQILKNVCWNTPILPAWAIPVFDVQPMITAMVEANDMDELGLAWDTANKYARAHSDIEMLKQFSENKDRAKQRIEADLALFMGDSLKEVESWLDRQLGQLVNIPNPSSLVSLKKAVLTELSKRCKNQIFDKDPLISKAANAFAERKNQLESNNDSND